MKYALVMVADQTHVYHSGNGWTTKHAEAKLFTNLEMASVKLSELSAEQAVFLKNGGHEEHPVDFDDEHIIELSTHWMELVEDETEFRSREDTW